MLVKHGQSISSIFRAFVIDYISKNKVTPARLADTIGISRSCFNSFLSGGNMTLKNADKIKRFIDENPYFNGGK